MTNNRKIAIGAVLVVAIVAALFGASNGTTLLKPKRTPTPTVSTIIPPKRTATPTVTKTSTPTVTDTSTPVDTPTVTDTFTPVDTPTDTLVPTDTDTPVDTPTPTDTVSITDTPTDTPTNTATPTRTPTPLPEGNFTPFPNAPLCPDSGTAHELTVFHTLWDSTRGCHYDHEHGANPFTQAVVDAFPGFNLFNLLGMVEIGHTNPSSPMENVMKHGGFKWQVQTQTAHACDNRDINGVPFEGAQYGVDAAVIEYHNFGNYSIEAESRIHSAAELIRVCNWANPSDKGYMYVVQLEDYGQRVVPYCPSGDCLIPAYPNQPVPQYNGGLGPYLSIDCVNGPAPCRISRQYSIDHNVNLNSIWTSKSPSNRYPGDKLFKLLFRIRDLYQFFDWTDQTYPFSFIYMCSSDGGVTYDSHMPGCRWNNSTTRVHEIAGTVPASWDNLAGFDSNPAVGRITASGFVTQYGDLNAACVIPSAECFPIQLKDMFVGTYGDEITDIKVSNTSPVSNPERDIYFCSGRPCLETDPGAISSGWIGPNN